MNLKPDDNPSPRLLRAMELISNLCDDRIDTAQVQELQSLILDDLEIRDLYLRMMHLDAEFHHFAPALGSGDPDLNFLDELRSQDPAHEMNESMVLPAMQDLGPDYDDEVIEKSLPLPPPTDDTAEISRRRMLRYLRGGAAALLVLGVGVVAHILLSHPDKSVAPSPDKVAIAPPVPMAPPPIPIATLDVTHMAVWDSNGMPPQNGNFSAGQTLSLKSGDAQLLFHRGGRMVIEGPAQIDFVSDTRLNLRSGKIVATVPGGGLVVDCPNGAVTDLGTEFGVAVDPLGTTEVAVFKGHVATTLSSTDTTQPATPMLLSTGQAAVITHDALTADPDGAVPQQFVRSLVNDEIKTLDVTDLISGGDGTTRLRGTGINANTGARGNFQAVPERYSDGKYHRIFNYPVLDGAFIPDGRKGPTVVDSAGDKFNFAPADGTSYDYIFTGGKIPWRWNPGLPTALDGIDYATPDHSIVFMHANNALTLDLDAIRRLYPGRHMADFHCRVGNSAVLDPKKSKANLPVGEVTARVLLNGIVHDEKLRLNNRSGSALLQVPLLDGDRFLTLATTNQGTGIGDDWLLWVDAKLDLSPGK